MTDQPLPSRARVLGDLRLEVGGQERRPPSGQVGALLQWMLLRPNVTHTVGTLVDLLWPNADDVDAETARSRLHVVVSRLRRFLRTGPDRREHELRVTTERDGYRLVASAGALDRVAFESLAARALDGEPEMAPRALTLWRADPYLGFPSWEQVQHQRAQLLQLHQSLRQLSDVEGLAKQPGHEFVRTKFLPAYGRHPGPLPRRRLLHMIGDVGEAALVAVTAPAGFGKSVLLAQWADAQSVPVAWVAVDPRDDEPGRFWAAVLQALTKVGHLSCRSVPADGAPTSRSMMDLVADSLASSVAPVGLVLDDAHNLTNHEVREQLAELSTRLSGKITVAMGSRPRIGPTKCLLDRADRQLTADDLQFDRDEMLAVVRSSDVSADWSDVAALAYLTRGWPVAVALLGQGDIRGGRLERSNRTIRDYIVDEVLCDLPADTRSFMLRTARLDELNVELGNTVADIGDAERHLDWLRRSLLVLGETVGDEPWCRYHPLVAEALRGQADADPQIDPADAHRRAARWYRRRGRHAHALKHAVEGGDDMTVLAVAGETLWAAVAKGKLQQSQEWLSIVSPDVISAARPVHDVAMMAAGAWLDPRVSTTWLMSRRHFGEGEDPMRLLVEAEGDLLQGRAGASLAASEAALRGVEPYFDRHPSLPGVREHALSLIHTGRLRARMLVGTVDRHASEPTQAMSEPDGSVPNVWARLLGDQAFHAYVKGDHREAAGLVDRVNDRMAAMDRAWMCLVAPRALVTTLLLESDRSDGPTAQARIGRELVAMLAVLQDVRWNAEVIPVLLGLQAVCDRAGRMAEALAYGRQAELLLGLCEDAPFLRVAQVRIGGGVDPEALLTPRERTVLQHLDAGLTYSEIAGVLGTSLHTVQSHTRSMYRKLGVRSRHGAARHRVGRQPSQRPRLSRVVREHGHWPRLGSGA